MVHLVCVLILLINVLNVTECCSNTVSMFSSGGRPVSWIKIILVTVIALVSNFPSTL